MNEAQITFTGNVCADADLRFTAAGDAVANFTVAVTPREKKDGQWADGEAAFYRVATWRQMAENTAESIRKGTRVTIVGRLKPREYEKDGVKRTSLDVDADSVALDIRFAPATAGAKTAERAKVSGGNDDAWATAPATAGWGTTSTEAPF